MPALTPEKKRPAARSAGRPLPELIFGDLWEYDPATETADPKLKPRYDLFIGGKFVAPASGKYFDSINPANETKLAEIAQANAADVDAAYAAAQKAFTTTWGKLPGKERAKYIYRLARLLQDRAREFAVAETMDGGKPIKESRDFDVPMAAAHFFYHAGWADKLDYVAPGRKVAPLGVVGQVIPWNFPLLMMAWKLAPALAMGNTIVIKPAETTSVTALKFAEIIQDAGLPPGTVNIVTGFGDTGAAVMNHPTAVKVAFTGSTEVGKIIMRSLAGTDKKMTMELGGKAANIVFDDAPLDEAIEGVVNGIFFNQGEVCCAGSRLFVQESILPAVIRKLRHRMASLRVGDPMDKNTDVGAINSKAQHERIAHYVRLGREEGATLHASDDTDPCVSPAADGKGFFCRPCFFSDVQPSHTIAREEIFGPVLSVMSFRTPDEAVSRANNTPYGLAAGVWTDKGSKVFDIARRLKAGVVWCNTYNKFDPASPFGGYKESGFGREGGVHGLRPYVDLD